MPIELNPAEGLTRYREWFPDSAANPHAELWHHVTGLASEAGEVLKVMVDAGRTLQMNLDNLEEEIADVFLYLESLIAIVGEKKFLKALEKKKAKNVERFARG